MRTQGKLREILVLLEPRSKIRWPAVSAPVNRYPHSCLHSLSLLLNVLCLHHQVHMKELLAE